MFVLIIGFIWTLFDADYSLNQNYNTVAAIFLK